MTITPEYFSKKQKTLFPRKAKLILRATESELLFKSKLDAIGIKYMFNKGFIQGDFYCIVDFYIPKPHKICFEIDGGYHDSLEQKRKDWAKDKYLTGRGFSVIRIKNEDVKNYNLDFLIKKSP